MKALALVSGGLDSSLAIKVILEQGIDVTAVHIRTRFGSSKMDHPAAIAQSLGVPILKVDASDDYIEMLKNPKHGYGAHFNPCIDCHTYMVRRAGQLLKEENASFVITGEVLGQRPMSQNKGSLIQVEKDSELEGLLVRPLSAKRLKMTTPEREGWVDRERLLGIEGRGRKQQVELAEKWGLTGFSAPAGGCLLTDKEFSNRLRDIFKMKDDLTDADIGLLKVGRHFYKDSTQIIVGRKHEENLAILGLKGAEDSTLTVADIPGPVTIIRGDRSDDVLEYAARLTAKYARAEGTVSVEIDDADGKRVIEVETAA
jgi:tRNA U34 2-thiouridine synthase MnmA/TrmU